MCLVHVRRGLESRGTHGNLSLIVTTMSIMLNWLQDWLKFHKDQHIEAIEDVGRKVPTDLRSVLEVTPLSASVEKTNKLNLLF